MARVGSVTSDGRRNRPRVAVRPSPSSHSDSPPAHGCSAPVVTRGASSAAGAGAGGPGRSPGASGRTGPGHPRARPGPAAPAEDGEQLQLGRGHRRRLAQLDLQPLHRATGDHQRQPHRDHLRGIPQPVQQRHQPIPANHGPAEPQPAPAGGGEQRPPGSPSTAHAQPGSGCPAGPRTRPGSAATDRSHGVATQAAGHQPQHGQLDRLLDRPDPTSAGPDGWPSKAASSTEAPSPPSTPPETTAVKLRWAVRTRSA
jgi:hypothetical protein